MGQRFFEESVRASHLLSEQKEANIGEVIQPFTQRSLPARIDDDDLLFGSEVIAVDQHGVLIIEEGAELKAVEGGFEVEAMEGCFIGVFQGAAVGQGGLGGLGVGIDIAQAVMLAEAGAEAVGQLLDQIAGGADNGPFVATEAAVGGAVDFARSL